MTISARIIADSLSSATGARLTTFEVTYPRFMHSELMTHRLFSRNAASTRAIPLARMIQMVQENPAMPIYWGRNQSGMQAAEELTGGNLEAAKVHWLWGRDRAVEAAQRLDWCGLHKQHAGRLLEPWAHITVIVSATDWANFYHLRRDAAALPEFRHLADLMYAEHRASRPAQLDGRIGIWQWHLPYITDDERSELDSLDLIPEYQEQGVWHPAIKVSVARCARVSYLKHGEGRAYAEDIARHDDMMSKGHWSPFEHVARAAIGRWGNFYGWKQYRLQCPTQHPYRAGQVFPGDESIY